MAPPPTGTVTFLFTDIAGSTRRWDEQPDAMARALARHDAILRGAIEQHGGHVFKTIGDAFCAAFATVGDAAAAAIAAQRTLATEPWDEAGPGAVRMAVHTGAADERGGDYFGPPLNRVARLLEAGHGGQVLVSGVAADLLRERLPDGVELRDLGERRLRDLARPERVYQLAVWGLLADFPPLRIDDDRRSALPVPLTGMVGREGEVAQVADLLGAARLVTLTGPGGTGKTRLALAVAERLLADFADGAVFVDLSPIADPGLVAPAIARTLGVRESEGRPVVDSLAAYLREKRLLLVLDNVEQVVEAAPSFRDLLGACAGLTLLATSRVPLRLSGEREFQVPPLPVPDTSQPADAASLAAQPSVALFVRRAQDTRSDFALTDENAAAVAAICARLDGLPLALELAAARIRVLGPEALRARLDHSLALLTGGGRDLPRRQQTLRNTVAWSHDLLPPDERALFRRLAVFAGGCSLEAAESVCNGAGDLGPDVLDGVASLVEKNLLRGGRADRGEPRFTMFVAIREFAQERLGASGEADVIRRAHAAAMLALAQDAGHSRAQARVGAARRLDEEWDNVREALRWCVECGEVESGARLLWALAPYSAERGAVRETGIWAERLLAHPEAAAIDASRARLLFVAGQGALGAGDRARRYALCEQAEAVSRAAADPACLAEVLRALGYQDAHADRVDAATPRFQESLALHRRLGNQRGVVLAIGGLAEAAARRGDLEAVRSLHDESLREARALGDPDLIANSLSGQSFVAELAGDFATARRLQEEGLKLRRADAENGITINTRVRIARLWLQEGETARAEPLLAESVLLIRRLGLPEELDQILHHLATAALARDDPARAARLLGAAEAEQARTGMRPPVVFLDAIARRAAAVRAALGDAAYAAAWAEGAALSHDGAIALALERTGEVPTAR